ncbi:hypothetical protein D9M68_970250 [compost metagenome]
MTSASHCVKTRTLADTWRFCGYSTDTGMGAGGVAGSTILSSPAASSRSMR